MVTVQPLGVETDGGTWAPVLLARVVRWFRDSRGVRRQNQPLDVWVARLGREGSDARQRVQDADVLTAAITCEDGGLQVVRLSLDDAALTPDAVAALLARTPSRSLAEARREGLFPQVLVDRASRGDSAWTSHLLTSSAWFGARVDAATGALELSFDHLVMDGTAMAELSLAASEGLPRREGRAAPGEWLTGPEEPSPLLRVELPEGSTSGTSPARCSRRCSGPARACSPSTIPRCWCRCCPRRRTPWRGSGGALVSRWCPRGRAQGR
ncbi:hypothetical protein QEG98_12390 [Myxococcus sp. MxC21-1]|uniref:hypothetical protein n=1 Tax=Myxococcus sp. MxC21-1 TaxID=3041439 RepID=UPI0029301E0D|nr:hypothetical protein [Myxococcus sp. MxC21-1]WNZ64398.1 hypothetical protein QEG98_12390 [Myxococcus sp. MxC21-1]